jgi:hypothetical protein
LSAWQYGFKWFLPEVILESRSGSDKANIASVARFVLIIPNLFPSTADPDYFPQKFRDLCDFFDGIVIAFLGSRLSGPFFWKID